LNENGLARERYEQALPIYRAIGDRLGEANCVRSLGDVHLRLNENGLARERYEQALPIYQAIGDRLGEANCVSSLGDVHQGVGNYSKAAAAYQESIVIYDVIQHQFAAAGACGGLAQVLAQMKEVDKAEACCKDVIERYRTLGDPGQLAWGFNSIGSVYDILKRHKEALLAFTKAVRLSPMNSIFYRNLADSAIKTGQFTDAERALETAESLQPEHPYLPLRRAQLALAQLNAVDALVQVELALSQQGTPKGLAQWVQTLSLLLLGRQTEAQAVLKDCIAATSDPHDFADYLEEAGQFNENHLEIEGMDKLIALLKDASV
jgi:tetratricopeptide (TPR) repeat protein